MFRDSEYGQKCITKDVVVAAPEKDLIVEYESVTWKSVFDGICVSDLNKTYHMEGGRELDDIFVLDKSVFLKSE